MRRADIKIVFMGSSEFAVPALEALHEAGYTIPYVVTQPDRIRGRGNKIIPTPVGEYAQNKGLELLKPERIKENEEFLQALAEAAPNLIVIVAYGKILPKSVLELPPLGCVNIHASLLPEYRGAAPIQRAILDGKQELGVTLMFVSEGLDTGDMITTAETAASDMNAGVLTGVLAQLGAKILIDTLPDIADGSVSRVQQDESKATYAEKIEKSDEKLDLNESVENIVRRVRAMAPSPGAYVLKGGERVVVTKARSVELARSDEALKEFCRTAMPGFALAVPGEGIYVRAGDGLFLIEELKIPGKKAMPVREYLKGNVFDTSEPLE